jgi:hypothetical protein
MAAGLCVSPLMGGLAVNGELLAAPFVVAGLAAMLTAVHERREGRAAMAAALAGAATVAALLVKQNMADVGVFAAVVLLVGWRRGELSGRRLRTATASYVAGAVLALAVTAVWTMLHGTSLAGVYDAMYPFRIQAGRLMASAGHHRHATARLWALLDSWVVSGGGIVMAAVVWALATRRIGGTGGLGAGRHRHVRRPVGRSRRQLLAPLPDPARGADRGPLRAARRPAPAGDADDPGELARRRRVLVGRTLTGPGTSTASTDGRAIGAVARTGDTIVTAFGHADLTQASGLRSPYPYLWSLPALTLDPHLTTLDSVLTGPHAPTWFVGLGYLRALGPAGRTTDRVLHADYHLVADLHGRSVYLRNGVTRPIPEEPGTDSADVAARSTTSFPNQEKP